MPDWVVKDRKDYAAFFLNLSRTGGEVVPFRSAGRQAFLVNWPEHAERVLSLNESNYENPYHPYRELSGHYEAAGSVLLQLKRAANTIEHTMLELNTTALNLSADLQASSSNGPINLMTSVKKRVFCAIARLLFGVNAQHLSDEFVSASQFAEECWANGLFTQPSSSPDEMEKHYRAAIQMQERTATWIAHEMRIVPEGQPVTDAVKQAIVRTILNGYNATATTMVWAIYLILRHGEVRTKVYREIDESFRERKTKRRDHAQLDYLKSVLRETLRLYPPAWVLGREALGEDRLGNTVIPKGSRVFISPYTMQRHSRLWEKPNEFIPERFNSYPSADSFPYAYFPFGGGLRRCPAGWIVLNHLQVLISVLLDSSHIELATTEWVKPRGLIALHPQPDVMVTAMPR